ncbi:carbonate dehydratase [Candidatus Magnetoovum chiemensis]|nr:carbonate dehydratase [Candidatus Magnetoovum chiemensis]
MTSRRNYVLFVLFVCLTLLSAGALYAGSDKGHGSHTSHWTYEGNTGPQNWGSLSGEFKLCAIGKSQSPIDIKDMNNSNMPEHLSKITFSYKAVPMNIVNNGHTIQVNYAPGSSITIDDHKYELVQFHFHSPSEHTVDTTAFPMEAHLVHKDAEGKLAVVGIFLKEGKKENAFLKNIWDNMPMKADEKKLDNAKMLNVKDLLPAQTERYYYTGSLTTPPCSEGVSWNVLKEPMEISKEQIAKYVSVMGANTARPVQPLNERQLELSIGN